MAFCINCGQELPKEAKFCSVCGKAMNNNNLTSQRKTVFEGEIHKCPNCGEVVSSFVYVCPACGLELRGKKLSHTLEKFIAKVDECERLIADNPSVKKGWNTWDNSKRCLWVILNVVFICIPIIIYLVFPWMFVKSTPKLTREEKQMASLVENFSFPNDRESVLAALIYTKEKIDFISKEKIDSKSAYWMRLWCAKAEQLKQKADMLFPEDNIVKLNYEEIVDDKERVKRSVKNKGYVGGAILVAALVCVVALGAFSGEKIKEFLSESNTTSVNVKNFSFELPHYWNEEGSKNEYLQYYAEKGDKVVMLSIAYPNESDENYDVSFKGLEADNENMIKAVERMFTNGDVIDHEVFESNHGIKGILYRFTYKQKISLFKKIDGSGYCFCFPSETDRRWFYVVLLHTNNVSKDKYIKDYMNMLTGIKQK